MSKTTFTLDDRACAMLRLAETDYRECAPGWMASSLTRSAIVRAALDEFMTLSPATREEAISNVLMRRWR